MSDDNDEGMTLEDAKEHVEANEEAYQKMGSVDSFDDEDEEDETVFTMDRDMEENKEMYQALADGDDGE